MTENVKQLKERCDKYLAEIGRLEARISHLQAENSMLDMQLSMTRSLKNQIKELYKSTDDYIVRALETRGRRISKARPRHDTLINVKTESLNTEKLLVLAHEYDVINFFKSKPPRSSKKLSYRVVGGVYKLTRDIAKTTAKTGYKSLKRGKYDTSR